MDRVTLDYDSYTYSFELKNEMWHQINRLIEKYEVKDDQVAIDLVDILRGHRENLGVDTPADPISYEKLMSYHLAFPPFFPNQKPFVSDDDFFVNSHLKYANPDVANIDNIIERRREWFEEEMEKKRERKVTIKYYDAAGWNSLPAGGLASLTPYDTGTTAKINYQKTNGEFAGSGRSNYVGALFEGHIHIDPVIKVLCLTSDDGSKLFLDGALKINNDGLHSARRKCTAVTEDVYSLSVEYFEKGGDAVLILQMGPNENNLRVVPPRSFASVSEEVLIGNSIL
jgi:hypothetical protein